ncbi:MAG: hypothetical protein IT204_21390 [Fimbriimonadaceae bacterium]|nr:hypothetical protein [Fimbriimonadaceae bacterium]
MRTFWTLLAVGLLAGVVLAQTAPAELTAHSDEFEDPATHVNWLRIEQVEGSTANQLLAGDINQTRPGWLTLVPRAVVWYRDWRGPFLHQRVSGDFVVTARLAITNRAGTGAPRSQFSLAGLLVRTPRQVTPQTWTPGGENYVFLSLGAADRPGSYQWETKTTVNSDSQLRLIPAPGGEGDVRIARVGPHLIFLRREPGGAWQVHQRYHRPDFPAELQVGLTCYTDWPTASQTPPAQHNFMALNGGNPDLRAQVDYVRYVRPPDAVAASGLALSDPASVPDAALLRWFGGD